MKTTNFYVKKLLKFRRKNFVFFRFFVSFEILFFSLQDEINRIKKEWNYQLSQISKEHANENVEHQNLRDEFQTLKNELKIKENHVQRQKSEIDFETKRIFCFAEYLDTKKN